MTLNQARAGVPKTVTNTVTRARFLCEEPERMQSDTTEMQRWTWMGLGRCWTSTQNDERAIQTRLRNVISRAVFRRKLR